MCVSFTGEVVDGKKKKKNVRAIGGFSKYVLTQGRLSCTHVVLDEGTRDHYTCSHTLE